MRIESFRSEGYKLQINGEVDPDAKQVDFVGQFLFGLMHNIYDKDFAEDFRWAAQELLANAITHRNGNEPRPYKFGIYLSPDRAKIEVEDNETDPYDPAYQTDLSPEGVLKGSGRGLFIARHFVDVVDVLNIMKNGSVVGHLAFAEKAYRPNSSSR